MESSVFNPRIFLGTAAAAGVLVVGSAVPAMAATKHSDHHPLKQTVSVAKGAVPTLQGVTGTLLPSVLNNPPVTNPIASLLGGIPIIGGLFGGTAGTDPVSGVLHGITSGGGIGSIVSGATGAVGGTIDGVAKALPGGSTVTGLLPGGSASSALSNLTGGITNGALGAITNAVPGVGSLTSSLPKLGG
jgi:hypothetical protein